MILYYLKIATQRILKNPLFAVINVIALSIGITAFYILFIHVVNEKSFDKHFNGYENIYRVISTPLSSETPWARSLGFIKGVSADMPEVENATQFSHCPIGSIEINEESFKQKDIMSIDSNFVTMFEVESVVGNLSEISEPNTVFITEDFAKKHFNNENPIGKTINIKALQYFRDLGEYQIRGVVKNTHQKTHFNYQILLSQKGALQEQYTNLLNRKIHWVYNYIKLKDNASSNLISEKLQKIYNESSLREVRGPQDYNFSLVPLADIHLKTAYRFELKESTSKINISLFIIISFVILFISLLNFVILNFAKLIKRSAELDVNRVFGANKRQLIGQVVVETLLLCSSAIAISLITIQLLKPLLNRLFEIDFSIYYSEPVIYLCIIGVLVICSLLSAFFVAFFLLRKSSTINILSHKKNYSGNFVLKLLLVLQTTIVIILISSTFVVNKQINFISQKSLGFNKENVLVIQLDDFSKDPTIFANELKKQSQVINVGFTRQYFGYPTQSIDLEGFGLEGSAEFVLANFDYLKTMDIPLTHNWIIPSADTIEGLIVNEHLYKRLLEKHGSMESLETFRDNQNTESENIPVKIIGVAKDFNYNSAHESIGDFAFLVDESPFRARFIHVRTNPGDLHATLAIIQRIWHEHYKEQEFNYFFIDEKVAEQYKAETILRRILTGFSFLGILVSIIGISALSLFISQQRTKEIGIRKVNGAKTSEILVMLNRDFVRWVAVAFVIACPIAYYLMSRWMENFAYKTTISWWIFALAGLITLLIALVTISLQTFSAARRNPIHSLKYE